MRGPAVLLLCALGACASTSLAEGPAGVDPAFEEALRALRVAVEERDDDLARSILDRVLAREPTGATLRQAEAFDRILGGRALARDLDLRLESVVHAGGTRVDVVLRASHPLAEELVLRCGGGRLSMHQLAVDERGRQQTVAETLALDTLRELRIPPGEGSSLVLGRFPLEVGGALAVRIHWSLRLGSGEFVLGRRRYPAMLLGAEPCEAVRLAAFLPEAPVGPEVLAEYLDAGRFATAPMLERAVRIEPERREEALDLLTPVLQRMDRIDLERAVPALRWLSGHPGGLRDPSEWEGWLEERARRRAPTPPPDPLDLPSALDLPDIPSHPA